MTTATVPLDHTLTRRTPAPTGSGTTFARTVAAEWIKFRTLRSTLWTLVATVVVMVGIAVLAAWGTSTQAVDGGGTSDLSQYLSAGYQMGQLAVAVLGVLTITGEYSTGMKRSTFAAVPRRGMVLGAKALVLAVVVLVVSVVSLALSYVATMPYHDDLGATLDLTDPGTLRMTAGLPLYLAAIALLAFAVGALVRHSAGALTGVIALLLVVENVLMIIPLRVVELVSPFLPSTAGRRILFDDSMLAAVDAATTGAHLSPWQGYAVLVAWVVALLALATALLHRRDA